MPELLTNEYNAFDDARAIADMAMKNPNIDDSIRKAAEALKRLADSLEKTQNEVWVRNDGPQMLTE